MFFSRTLGWFWVETGLSGAGGLRRGHRFWLVHGQCDHLMSQDRRLFFKHGPKMTAAFWAKLGAVFWIVNRLFFWYHLKVLRKKEDTTWNHHFFMVHPENSKFQQGSLTWPGPIWRCVVWMTTIALAETIGFTSINWSDLGHSLGLFFFFFSKAMHQKRLIFWASNLHFVISNWISHQLNVTSLYINQQALGTILFFLALGIIYFSLRTHEGLHERPHYLFASSSPGIPRFVLFSPVLLAPRWRLQRWGATTLCLPTGGLGIVRAPSGAQKLLSAVDDHVDSQ